MQGWGEAPDDEYNAISRADTPFMDSLKKGKPGRWTLVSAHGKWVGLNESDMGNSEAGSSSQALIVETASSPLPVLVFIVLDHFLRTGASSCLLGGPQILKGGGGGGGSGFY